MTEGIKPSLLSAVSDTYFCEDFGIFLNWVLISTKNNEINSSWQTSPIALPLFLGRQEQKGSSLVFICSQVLARLEAEKGQPGIAGSIL